MASDGQIVFEVTADGRHAMADIQELTRAIQRETRNWDDAASNSANNIGNSFSGMLKKLTGAFTAAKLGKALLDFGKDAIEAASDLEEVQNVVDVTFGRGAREINDWAKNATAAFGLTETQAKRFASTLGAMMKSSGVAGSEITKMSTDLAGLAADMASFYNLDFDTAFQKISSGISGETQPLKALGINMSVANLNAFALSQGLEKTFEQMDSGEQTMLRYQYIMSATADAQGDFTRTSDGYANSMRLLETNIEKIKTKLGEFLIGPAADALAWVNDFMGQLFPAEGTTRRTVLDDFEDIDIDTNTKLEEIRKTAEEARLLTEELTKINNTKVEKVTGNIQQLADGLTGINFEQGKVGALNDFISVLGANIDIIAAIQGTDAEGAAAWLESISNAANTLDADDAAGWSALIQQIREGLPGIENTEFGESFFSALSAGYEGVAGKASVFEWAVDSLGSKTERTAEEQAMWLEVCNRLVQTIPGLSSIINTETGEIKGGTQAVKDYINAWEEGNTKLAMMRALEQKETALSSRFSDLPGLQLDAALAEKRVRDQKKKLDELRKKYGIAGNGYDLIVKTNQTGGQGTLTEAEEEWNAAVTVLGRLKQAEKDATDEYNAQAEACEEAKIALEEYRETIEEMPGDAENAARAIGEWSEETKQAARDAVDVAGAALEELNAHIDSVRENVAAAVDGVVKGFEKITRPTQEYKDKISDLITEQQKYKPDSEEYKRVQKQIDALNESMEQFTPKGMKDALDSQLSFMDEYLSNLEKAQKMGLSDDLLASLSDGSAESAEYLAALVADPTAAREIDQKYLEVQEKKKQLTDALTEQQLTVDEVYQQMLADAREAVNGLDLEDEAKTNSGKTVEGIAQGIKDNVDDVSEAVDAVLSEIDRLAQWGITFNFGGASSPVFIKPTHGTQIQKYETGLDVVPYDGFLASLHAGEGILTAEENRIWQRFKNGGAGIDYDVMGGVMRDNIKPGGNVYLNGRVVGSVISDQQGASFRQMKRSGFQS